MYNFRTQNQVQYENEWMPVGMNDFKIYTSLLSLVSSIILTILVLIIVELYLQPVETPTNLFLLLQMVVFIKKQI